MWSLVLLAVVLLGSDTPAEVPGKGPAAEAVEPDFPPRARPCYWRWGTHLYRVTFRADGTYTATDGPDLWEGTWARKGNTMRFREVRVMGGGEGGKGGRLTGPARSFRVDLAPGKGCVVGAVRGDYHVRHVSFYGYD